MNIRSLIVILQRIFQDTISMKKLRFAVFILAALLISASTKANPFKKEQVSLDDERGGPMFFKTYYIRGGLNMPLGNYNKKLGKSNFLEDGMSGSTGYIFSMGNYFYFTRKPISGRLKIGLDLNYLNITYNESRFSELDSKTYTYNNAFYFTYAFKLGAIATWSISDKVAFDASVKAAPTLLLANGVWETEIASGDETQIISTATGLGIKTNFSITAKYGVASLTLGCDLGRIPVKYGSDDNSGIRIPQSAFQLMLGLQL